MNKTYLLKLVLLISVLASLTSCDDPTYGTEWQGDYSSCMTYSPADSTIQTIGGDVGGIFQEFGAETHTYSSKPGCDNAYIIDYLMPPAGTNVNPGWDWAWIHVASRIEDIDENLCKNLWTSMRVYAYWTFRGKNYQELKDESYRLGVWDGHNCDFGIPDNVWMSSSYERIRVVSQHGGWLLPLQPHYSYFVTNRN